MILTYKIKHNLDLTNQLRKAKQVAEFALKAKSWCSKSFLSSKQVKDIGLPSTISCQILKKYFRNKKIKKISREVKLVVPNQGIKKEENFLKISCLKAKLDVSFLPNFIKVNQIEFDRIYAYVSVTIEEIPITPTEDVLGVDLNATGYIAVASNPKTGKVWKFGKKAPHIHKKYKAIRRKLQKRKKFKQLKRLKNRESRIVRDINHKIAKRIVKEAKFKNCKIVLENLKGIRKNKKHAKSFNYSLNSWSFYQLKQFIEYKAKLQGVEVVYIDPRYTSKTCSKCNNLGNRQGKSFKCPQCGHVEDADVNASFNIGQKHVSSVLQSSAHSAAGEGCTDKPKKLLRNDVNFRTPRL